MDPAALLAGDRLADRIVLCVSRRERAQEEEAAGPGGGGKCRRELPAADRPQQVVDVAAEDDVVGAGVLRVARERPEVAGHVLRVEARRPRAAQRGRVLLARGRDRRRRRIEAHRPAAELAGEVARVAAVAAADVEDRDVRSGIRAQAGDGEASQLARPVAPHALVGCVAPLPVQGGLWDAGRARRRPARSRLRQRRHASRYFSEVLAATSGGSSGPGAVLSQSSVSR